MYGEKLEYWETAFTCVTYQQMHIYTYVQSRIVILHCHVLVSSVAVIMVSCNMSTVSVE
jgi:hypothetical protein